MAALKQCDWTLSPEEKRMRRERVYEEIVARMSPKAREFFRSEIGGRGTNNAGNYAGDSCSPEHRRLFLATR